MFHYNLYIKEGDQFVTITPVARKQVADLHIPIVTGDYFFNKSLSEMPSMFVEVCAVAGDAHTRLSHEAAARGEFTQCVFWDGEKLVKEEPTHIVYDEEYFIDE